MENPNNIVRICDHCAKAQVAKPCQELLDDAKIVIQVGDYVKTKFTDHNRKANEHMWCLVTKIEDKKHYGRLDNEPVLVGNVHYGQICEMKMKTISGFIGNRSGVDIKINPIEAVHEH
jgi:uncharacterized protein YegJ (DUF2314 family)